MNYYTTKEAAAKLGLTQSNICALCKRYDVKRLGNSYIIDDETLSFLESRKGKSGRPKKEDS